MCALHIYVQLHILEVSTTRTDKHELTHVPSELSRGSVRHRIYLSTTQRTSEVDKHCILYMCSTEVAQDGIESLIH